MTTRDTPWPDGTPCWVDLMVPDPRMAMDFYGALLGWDFADQGDEAGNYLLCSRQGRNVAGIGAIPPDQAGARAAWTIYLATSDLAKIVAAISESGGNIVMPPMDVMQAGKMAIAADPTGSVFGLWQAVQHTGIQLANVPNSAVWMECITRDFDRAKGFYGTVFGYEFDDMSAGGYSYAALKVGGNVVGGLGQMSSEAPADVPPHWSVYFGVTDTDAAVARVGELGGDVVRPPTDSPYGRMSTVTDNQGSYFVLISVTESA
ncbi:VOC family protein [Saccharomonospora sp. NPDC046836]|uniref:VOC family protein n=1 Tax=Saccharomonospora sp. NPDC046836 TaxID=3156921 RepID=UPI0034079CC3